MQPNMDIKEMGSQKLCSGLRRKFVTTGVELEAQKAKLKALCFKTQSILM
jgi:hypothetical protein